MTGRSTSGLFRTEPAGTPADWPPAGLPGLDPAWSRHVQITDSDGIRRTFHLLDSQPDPAAHSRGTLVCLHGNPTWSYLWRRLLAEPPPGWRVIAPDHLGMGHSERPDRPRALAQRVDDLSRLTDALGLAGPVVTVAHDWGGIIALGWAAANRTLVAGVVLTNTAVHQPDTSAGPILIRAAHVPLVNRWACRRTPLFVRATSALSWPPLPRDVRDALAEPYRGAARRAGVSDFVADIPFADQHRSRPDLDAIAEDIRRLRVPALILWGPRDPVFQEMHLKDLQERLPQAAVHRYQRAGHLVPEDAPEYAQAVADWVGELPGPDPQPEPGTDTEPDPAPKRAPELPSVLSALQARRRDIDPAVVEVGGDTISWSELHAKVRATAAGLVDLGLEPGQRVALLIPPSIDLTTAVYAVWWAGGVVVLADRGLGLRGMGRALRSARIDFVIAGTAGLLAASAMRLPGRRIGARLTSRRWPGPLGARTTLPALQRQSSAGHHAQMEPQDGADREAAVLFTSGATGPAKGVRYRHHQLRAQLQLIRHTYQLGPDDRIVAAFAPFALYGPALGLRSAVPDSDVTRPAALTAAALAEAAAAIEASVVFASPAALRNVLATADRLTAAQRTALTSVRLLMSAGAPVPAGVLSRLAEFLQHAEPHTPYGMTEVLPLTDISLSEIQDAGPGDGVCVGRALPGVQLRVSPLDEPDGELTGEPGRSGEIWARAAHQRDGYDALWQTDQAAARHRGWHRTGDVGMVDAQGRWWVQGRTVHVISTDRGPVTPVGAELAVARTVATGVALVGVGPPGAQQIVVVLTGSGGPLAAPDLADRVRDAVSVPVAAVLIRKDLPVDIRHNSKVDRVAVARWAAMTLAGG